jgi:hypothetical protein
VQDYAATVARLRARGVAIRELEIPHGPCATFTTGAGQRYAVYQLVRPDAVHLFDGPYRPVNANAQLWSRPPPVAQGLLAPDRPPPNASGKSPSQT